MSDIQEDDKPWNIEHGDSLRHRCTMKRARRGKPRPGDRASCECGAEYVWVARPFAQWLPV